MTRRDDRGRVCCRSGRALLVRAVSGLAFLIVALAGPVAASAAPPQAEARTVLVLFSPGDTGAPATDPDLPLRFSRVHTRAEVVLNHLGLVARYHDVNTPLPAAAAMADVRGVLMWFEGTAIADPNVLLRWLLEQSRQGRPLVLLGDLSMANGPDDKPVDPRLLEQFLAVLGLSGGQEWISRPYGTVLSFQDPRYLGFERPLKGLMAPYYGLTAQGPQTRVWLSARRETNPEDTSVLVAQSPTGAFAADGYDLYVSPTSPLQAWLIDPFAFLSQGLHTDTLPKPDVTTLVGRRLYYSHIDGDGWNSLTEVPEYRRDGGRAITTRVIREKVIEPFPDLPVSVAPVIADIHPDWRPVDESLPELKAMAALPQVELSSHTWTHPLSWRYFLDYTPDKEQQYRDRDRSDLARMGKDGGKDGRYASYQVDTVEPEESVAVDKRYEKPRAYSEQPFDLRQELVGSLDWLAQFARPGEKPRLIQWSGDTLPYRGVMKVLDEAGIANLNGGDPRFDLDYPSVSFLSPIGRQIGPYRQIYSSASNENTYTDLWTDKFFAYRNLQETHRNAERGRRLKPFNIYYHMYSGEKPASVNALLANLGNARQQQDQLVPIRASAYADLAQGFYTLRLLKEGENRWRVLDRGSLNTLRIDRATFRAVDFAASRGVLGQRHYQGSLYVALDPAEAEPVVALRDLDRADRLPPAPMAWLRDSRWPIRALIRAPDRLTFEANGFGDGVMTWWIGPGRTATPSVGENGSFATETADADGYVTLRLPVDARSGVRITVRLDGPPPG